MINDNNNDQSHIYTINLINIQGLTKVKMIEVVELIGDKTIVCLTETQLKVQKININESYSSYDSMRDEKDIKGGGILMFHKTNPNIKLIKIANTNKDYLYVNGEICGKKINIILVYFSCRPNDQERNANLKRDIEKHLNQKAEE